MKQSCDTYFYEVSRLLGVDRLNITAKIWFGKKVLGEFFDIEKEDYFQIQNGKNNLGKGWVLGETLITGMGQGYTSYSATTLHDDSSNCKWRLFFKTKNNCR